MKNTVLSAQEIPDYSRTTWFDRQLDQDFRTPQFYIMPKVHKTPLSTRPVVSCVNSLLEVASKWLDVQMTGILHLSRTYIKDSNEIREELICSRYSSTESFIFTADAVSMYTNIDTNMQSRFSSCGSKNISCVSTNSLQSSHCFLNYWKLS